MSEHPGDGGIVMPNKRVAVVAVRKDCNTYVCDCKCVGWATQAIGVADGR